MTDPARLRPAAQWLQPQANPATPVADVVRHLGAVQAQDYSQSLWALGSRIEAATIHDITVATERREIVRTWGMRGTLHWLAAEDVEWTRQLFAPRILARTGPSVWAYHRVDHATADRAGEIVEEALTAGDPVSRRALSVVLHNAGIPDDRQQHYFLYARLSHLGLIVHGPRSTEGDTFALRSRWLPAQRNLSHDEGLATLATRFFTSHGPATLEDFARWSGLGKRVASTGLQHVTDSLLRTTTDDNEYWSGHTTTPHSGALLLPGYDELVIGYADRAPMFRQFGTIPISTYNGMFYALIVIDGQIAGTWKHIRQRTRLRLDIRVADGVDTTMIEQAAKRLGDFHCTSAHLVMGPPPDRAAAPSPWRHR